MDSIASELRPSCDLHGAAREFVQTGITDPGFNPALNTCKNTLIRARKPAH